MKRRNPFQLPTMNALFTFESAARLGRLSLAAKELRTSQPAISRDIAKLEKMLSTRLFERSRNGVTLTDAGRRFHDAVVNGISIIHAAASEIASQPDYEQVVIACSHEASHCYLMPQFEALQEALGAHVRIRILTYHHHIKDLPSEPAVDVMFCWEAAIPDQEPILVHKEAVRPLCSPDYAARHADILNGPVHNWSSLTFLDHIRPNEGWATWEDWFKVAGHPQHAPQFVGFDSYVYMLEAAAAGRGLVLGWRYFIERYLQIGVLVELSDGFIEFDNHYCGVLTERGRKNPMAYKCLKFLDNSAKILMRTTYI